MLRVTPFTLYIWGAAVGGSISPVELKVYGVCDSYLCFRDLRFYFQDYWFFYFHGKTQAYTILANKIPGLHSN